MFLFILALISVCSAALWLHWLFKVFTFSKEKEIKLRGILKKCLGDRLNSEQKLLVKKWVFATFFISLVACAWVTYLSWDTDYSFLIGLFPIVWFYWLIRALLWEKSELIENM